MTKDEANERQGGTPYMGRIPPGKERGGCKPQNQPNVPSEPTGKDKKLLQSCVAVAESLGHDPKLWFYDPYVHCGQIMCMGCRKFAGFTPFPCTGSKPIEGWCVENRCGLAKED